MPLQFRSTSADDLPRIQGLLQAAFNMPAAAPALDAALLQWKYWEAGTSWKGSRSFALEQDGNLVAHGSIWPIDSMGDGAVAANLLDWAAARMPPGAGISLVRRLADIVPVLVSTGGSEATRAIMPRIGFKHAGNQNIFVRVLRPWKQHRTRPRESPHRALPRLVRNASWSVAPPVALRGWETRTLDSLNDPAASHVLRCPAATVSGWSLEQHGKARGYFVLSRVAGQSRIARLRIDSDKAADRTAAYAIAAASAMTDPEACELVALSSSQKTNEALDANGFHYRDQRPMFVYDPRKALPPNAGPLQLDMLDDDMAYLNTPEYPYFA